MPKFMPKLLFASLLALAVLSIGWVPSQAIEPMPTGKIYLECAEWAWVEPDAAGGTGVGSGSSRADAMREAIINALIQEGERRVRCPGCPQGQCGCWVISDPAVTDPGGAYMEDPGNDCTYNSGTDSWQCNGWVNFGDNGGDVPAAYMGCERCWPKVQQF